MPPPLFPHRGADPTAAGGIRLARTVDPELTGRVRDLARARDATPFAVLLAAFGMAISTLTGRRDLVVGCPVAGRTHSDLDGVVGFFVNTLPIRLRLDESAFTELVDQVRELSVEAFDRQDIPYEQISAAVRHGLDTQPQGTPLFEVMFNYLEGKALPGRSRTRRPAGTEQTSVTGGTHSDLELYALDFGDELRLELVYADGAVGARTAQDLLDLIMKILDDPPARGRRAPKTPPHRRPNPSTAISLMRFSTSPADMPNAWPCMTGSTAGPTPSYGTAPSGWPPPWATGQVGASESSPGTTRTRCPRSSARCARVRRTCRSTRAGRWRG